MAGRLRCRRPTHQPRRPVSSWTLTWNFPAGQRVTQAWNSTVSQSGAAGHRPQRQLQRQHRHRRSASFGFNGSWTGSNPVPTAFAMNGTACTGVPSGNPSSPSPSGPTSPSPGNPTWGTALPPANAVLSHAYTIIYGAGLPAYQPQAGECSWEVHARYWTYGPDGKVYPTWHPARDPSGCAFGHEHGDDPRASDLFGSAGWPAFGYTSEVQMDSAPATSHRHEDHVGHKVLSANNVNVIQGDNGISFFPPQGTTVAVCDVLLKIHQGTHSPDAFTNNVHELLFNQRCTASNGGQVSEVRFSMLIPLGHPV